MKKHIFDPAVRLFDVNISLKFSVHDDKCIRRLEPRRAELWRSDTKFLDGEGVKQREILQVSFSKAVEQIWANNADHLLGPDNSIYFDSWPVISLEYRVSPHPPHIPDLAPSHFYLFGQFRDPSRKKKIVNNRDGANVAAGPSEKIFCQRNYKATRKLEQINENTLLIEWPSFTNSVRVQY